ncbi:TPA: hypothetical protein ACN33X_001388 [Vibrio parahaemolyticus]
MLPYVLNLDLLVSLVRCLLKVAALICYPFLIIRINRLSPMRVSQPQKSALLELHLNELHSGIGSHILSQTLYGRSISKLPSKIEYNNFFVGLNTLIKHGFVEKLTNKNRCLYQNLSSQVIAWRLTPAGRQYAEGLHSKLNCPKRGYTKAKLPHKKK